MATMNRHMPCRDEWLDDITISRTGKKMTHFAQSISLIPASPRLRLLRWLPALAILAAVAAPDTALSLIHI